VKFSAAIAALGTDLPCALGSDPELLGVADLRTAAPGTLSYVEGPKFARWLETTAASALILPPDEALQARAAARGIAWVAGADPRLLFARAIALFYRPFRVPAGIHPTATVDPTATLGSGVAIAAGAVVQAGATLGEGVCMHPGAVVYPGAEIGDRVVLHANCTIGERTLIGNDCVIHSGAVVGGEGFGFVPTAQGWVKMEQSGRVVLAAGVEVGSNSAIDRPAVGETRVGANTKIDNLVQIGHGCVIGANCAIAAQVGLAGGVRVGDGVLLAGKVGVANQVEIGDRAVATANAGIYGNVPAGMTVSGYPAIPHAQHLRASAIHKKLPELYESVRRISKQLGLDRASHSR